MNSSLLLWMLLAILIFWGVGLYNRLMRMRARGFGDLGTVEKHMRNYVELVNTHLGPPASERRSHDWDSLQAMLQVLDHALKDANANPLAVQPLIRVAVAFKTLQHGWTHLLQAADGLAGTEVPEALRLQWATVTVKVETARGGFNQIMTQYNEAMDQFPARLIVGILGLKTAGHL